MDPAYGRVLIPNQNTYTNSFVNQEGAIRYTTQGRPLRSERLDSTATSYSNRYVSPITTIQNRKVNIEPRLLYIQSVIEKNQKIYFANSTNSSRVENI